MTELLTRWNTAVNGVVWGPPMLVLLIGTGVLLTLLTGLIQIRHLHTALREVLGKLTHKGGGAGSVTPFQAVATALASTVGVGNIAGVATAIFLGGPGALFWLWISGLVGMATKYAAGGLDSMMTCRMRVSSCAVLMGLACGQELSGIEPPPEDELRALFRIHWSPSGGAAATRFC